MKEKIFDALKTKYSKLGFGAKALDGVASYLEKTVTDESQIETAISGVEPLLKVFQADADRARTEYNSLKSQFEELKKSASASTAAGGGQESNETSNAPETDFDTKMKAWFEKNVKPLQDQIEAYKAKETASARQNLIISKAKEYGIPEKLAAKFSVAEDADLDDFFKGLKQDFADTGFEFSEPPMQGNGVTNNANDVANLISKGTEQIVKQNQNQK